MLPIPKDRAECHDNDTLPGITNPPLVELLGKHLATQTLVMTLDGMDVKMEEVASWFEGKEGKILDHID